MRTHSLIRAAPLVVSIGLLAVCEPRDDSERETRPAREVPAPAPSPDARAARPDTVANARPAQRTIPFQPGPRSATSGTVTITETRARAVEIGVNLRGLSEGEHAWHVRRAPCGVDGPIVIPASPSGDQTDTLGEPLRADADGTASGTVTVPPDQVPHDLRYAVRPEDPRDPQSHAEPLSLQVHARAGDDPGPIVACADLTVAAPPTTR